MNNSEDLFNLSYQFNKLANGQNSDGSLSTSPSAVIDKEFSTLVMDALKGNQIQAYIKQLIYDEVKVVKSKYEKDLSFMQGCVDSLICKVSSLEEDKKRLSDKLEELEAATERQEQYSCRTSLRITNNWPETRGENTENMILNMSNELLNTPLSPNEIRRTHRVGPHYKNGSPRPVIVKFLSYKSREKVLRAASKLPMAGEKSRGVFINEDLTKDRSKVFSIARQLKKSSDIQDCWTHDGVIFIRDFKAVTRAFDNPSKCLQ